MFVYNNKGNQYIDKYLSKYRVWTVSLTVGEVGYAQYCCGKHIKMYMYCEHTNSNYDNMTKYLPVYSLKTLSFKLTVLQLFNLLQPLILFLSTTCSLFFL